VLAAIAVPAVMRTITSARNAAIKSEIDLLHMAIMNYKNEYGSFPPCSDLPGGVINKHVSRIFPRAISGVPANLISVIQPDTALSTWLSGYSSNPLTPLNGDRKKLFDFDESRRSGDRYWPAQKPKSPYIYINSAQYTQGSGPTLTIPIFVPNPPLEYSAPYAGYFAHRVPATPSLTAFADLTQPAFNADTFQIISAGRDEIFGNEDDLSNFWPGTRKDYLDSLSN